MAEQLGGLTRTHTCGALRTDDVGADVVLLGWVHRVRDLGGLLFIDVRDRYGITQIVFDKDDEALMNKAKRLRSEFVVGVSGRVRRRSEETVNPKLETGEVEVVVRQLAVRAIHHPPDRIPLSRRGREPNVAIGRDPLALLDQLDPADLRIGEQAVIPVREDEDVDTRRLVIAGRAELRRRR